MKTRHHIALALALLAPISAHAQWDGGGESSGWGGAGGGPGWGGAGGEEPTDWQDIDGDGFVLGEDCNPFDDQTYPGAPEACDGQDNDCDGATDEGVTATYYIDADGDGFGSQPVQACGPSAGIVDNGDDCDDTRDRVFPGAFELCDARDTDCDGEVDLVAECAPELIYESGPAENRVDLIIIGEGFTFEQQDTVFTDEVQRVMDFFFADPLAEPYGRYQQYFNIYRVPLISEDAGVDDPDAGIFVDTALGAHRTGPWRGAVDNALTKAVFAAAETRLGIEAEARLLLVNTPHSMGYAVMSADGFAMNSTGKGPVISLHELGHHVHRLCDEYGGNKPPLTQEPNCINMTIDPTGAKWSHWLGYVDPLLGEVGTYEGGHYRDEGTWRSTVSSMMGGFSDYDGEGPPPLNPISKEKMIHDIYRAARPIDGGTPNGVEQVNPAHLDVDVIDDTVVRLNWFVDGTKVCHDCGTRFDVAGLGLAPGTYTVRVKVRDLTDMVRIDPERLLRGKRTWTVRIE